MQREMVRSRRRDLLLGEVNPALLEVKAAGMYRDLCALHGKEILGKVEREITLFHQDRCWSDYLARAAAYYFPVTIFLIISRFLGKLLKKSKRKTKPTEPN
jgi:hypothetical protein